MSIEVELAAFYQKHGFGEQVGKRPLTVGVYTGCMLVPLPNIETRRRMWRAFKRGCVSRNIYAADVREAVDVGHWHDVAALRDAVLEARPSGGSTAASAVEFGVHSGLSLAIHACLAIPAVIARFFSDTLFGVGFFQAVKPRPRTDLY